MANSGYLHTLGACRLNGQTPVLVLALSQLGCLGVLLRPYVVRAEHRQPVVGTVRTPRVLWETAEQVKDIRERLMVEEMALAQSFRC